MGYADPNKAIAMHIDEEDKLNDKTALSLGQRGGWGGRLYSVFLKKKHHKNYQQIRDLCPKNVIAE